MSYSLSTAFPGAAPSAPTVSQKELLQIVQVALRCWWKLAMPVGLLLATGAMLSMTKVVSPRYTAATWIEIRERPDVMLLSASPEDPRKYVQNQLELLRSPLVIDRVTANPAVASTPELADQRDIAAALRGMLKIRPMGQSDYFVIEFTSTAADKAALIANEVAAAYLELQERNDSQRTQRIIDLLKQQQANQQQVVHTHRDNVRVLAIDRTGKDPFAVEDSKSGLQPRNPLADLQLQLTNYEADQIQLQAEIQTLEEMLVKESFDPAPGDVAQAVALDPSVVALERQLLENQVKREAYERDGVNLSNNQFYKQLVKETDEAEELLKKTRSLREAEIAAQQRDQSKKRRERELAQLKTNAQTVALKIQFLQKRLGGQFENRKKYEGESLDLEFKRADYERSNKIHDLISHRILNLEFEQYAQSVMGRVKLFKRAEVPTGPNEALPYKQMGLAGMAAFLLPFGLAIGVEFLNRRVSDRHQLESAKGIQVVGEITALPRRQRPRRLGVNSPSHELQLFEESIDGLRTYLTVVDSLREHRTFAVMSAISQEGKSNLAAQLAMSVASATGEQILLIDGDMRSPDVDEIFGVNRDPGLAGILLGECSASAAIHKDFSENLHLLPAGTLSTSPHRLLGKGEFGLLLTQLREQYRYIIVDTPPILPACESLVMARAADAAVLCVRRDYSRIEQVAEAYQRLQAAGVKTAGAVINGIPVRSYVYRYGSYYYRGK